MGETPSGFLQEVKMSVVRLYEGDQRAETLLEALRDTMWEYGKDMPIPTILGVLQLAAHGLITQDVD